MGDRRRGSLVQIATLKESLELCERLVRGVYMMSASSDSALQSLLLTSKIKLLQLVHTCSRNAHSR